MALNSCKSDIEVEDTQESGGDTIGQDVSEQEGDGSEGGGEAEEAAMSSPIVPLGESWDGALDGLAVSMQYDIE